MPLHQFRLPGYAVPFVSDLQMPEIPKFTRLSGTLTRIASPAGVTYLKQGSIKSGVYLGSKYHAVDIEGIPWAKKSELKKITRKEKYVKKRTPVETGVRKQFLPIMKGQISENLLTSEPGLLTIPNELSTIDVNAKNIASKPEKRLYKIKKTLVRNRLLAYTNTKKGSKCLYFFTVTFPAGMPEPMGYRILNTWFTSLRKQKLLREYLWVAERQKNGTIHFHIAVPHFMKVQHVNGIMRKILLGYAIRKEIPFSPEKFGPKMYNGVDIAGTPPSPGRPKEATNFAHKKKSGSLANYLTKYVTKNNETFEHLAWHNSRGFSALFYSVALSRESFQITGLHNRLNWAKAFYSKGISGTPADGLFVFVPWFGNAPPLFWDALKVVNNFFQSLN